MTNRLAAQTSPYLLQHAENPVDWYPWGEEALGRAKAEDKPIFLSIGYSACHWCHVMEHESFSDENTAALMNQRFVCIKVDREERPDLDAIYMDAVSSLTGRGGWPLSVWLTPDGEPFYGGTYFPDSSRYGMPSFLQVITAVSDAWTQRRAEVTRSASLITQNISEDRVRRPPNIESTADDALRALSNEFDSAHGGWGGAPKFPQPMVIEFLMMRWQSSRDDDLRTQVEQTLRAMAAGGIFDQLRGGFHRYSTDDVWLVPHFEKMLYDNAQLARCYLHAWQLFGDDLYRRVARETLDYLVEEMRHSSGAFFSSQDADSEGVEGKFFVWSLDEIKKTLSPEETKALVEAYGASERGNFEGRNILQMVHPGTTGMSEVLAAARANLLKARNKRVRPGRDDKVLAAWNGLALAAFADAARCLESPEYLEVGLRLAEFLATEIVDEDFSLTRSWKDGRRGTAGFLEDYACLADGFLALYQATFDEKWFAYCRGLADRMLEDFSRPAGGFFDTGATHERLIMRPRTLQDTPTPSGNSLAATMLVKLAAFAGESRYQDAAEQTLRQAAPRMAAAPTVFGQWLCLNELVNSGLTEVALVADASRGSADDLVSAVSHAYLPYAVVASRPSGESSTISILADREPPAGAGAAAWVCRHQTCLPPITSVAALREELGLFDRDDQPGR